MGEQQPNEQAYYIAVLENQRNAAMNELARAVAHINSLNAQLAQAQAQIPKDKESGNV